MAEGTLILLLVVVATITTLGSKKSLVRVVYIREFESYEEFIDALKNHSDKKTKTHRRKIKILGGMYGEDKHRGRP